MEEKNVFLRFLKKKRIIDNIEKAGKELSIDEVLLKKNTDLYIRDSISTLGTILLEDLNDHYYILSVKIGIGGSILTYGIITRKGEIASIIAYGREGIIKQGLAKKTVEKLKKALS